MNAGYPTRRACRPVAATAQSTCSPPPPLSPPLRQLAESSPSYAAILTTQDIIVQHLTDSLQLSPAGEGSAAPGGLVEVEASEGGAGARVRCLTGQDVRWLSASTLGRGDVGFGGTIITGFCDGASDTPHFLLEQTLHGGSVLLVLALWPRRDWMLDGAYLQRYYGSGGGALRVLHGLTAGQPASPCRREMRRKSGGHQGAAPTNDLHSHCSLTALPLCNLSCSPFWRPARLQRDLQCLHGRRRGAPRLAPLPVAGAGGQADAEHGHGLHL